jgi:hypothetical protein
MRTSLLILLTAFAACSVGMRSSPAHSAQPDSSRRLSAATRQFVTQYCLEYEQP